MARYVAGRELNDIIEDSDEGTRIQVEEITDENIIHFDIDEVEMMTLDSKLTIHGADVDKLVLGDATHEGGDLRIYRNNNGNFQIHIDADAGPSTVALEVYGGIKAAYYDGVEFAYYYGIMWDESDDTYARTGHLQYVDCGTKPDDVLVPIHTCMKRCVVNDSGVVQYYLDPNDSTKKYDQSNADLTGADGQVMVEVPAFYYRYIYTGTKHFWDICQRPLTNFSLHPAFIIDGVAQTHIYIGAYEASLYDVSASRYANVIDLSAGSTTFTRATRAIVRNDETNSFSDLEVGDIIVITGTTSNNATHTVSVTGDNSIRITDQPTDETAANCVITTQIDTTNDKLGSVSGKSPVTNATRAQFRTMAQNRGTDWFQQDMDKMHLIQLLYLIEYGCFNSQVAIGNGLTDWSVSNWNTYNDYNSINKTGLSNSSGNHTVNVSNGDNTVGSYMSYRGIENIYGHILEFVDGFNINDNVPYVCEDPDNFADDTATNYTNLGLTLATSDGWENLLEQSNRVFLPASVGASSSTKLTDYYTQGSGWRVATSGGEATSGLDGGMFNWVLSGTSSTKNSYTGTRLVIWVITT